MLAIAGGKGGCGKTTTTAGLGAALEGLTLAAGVDCDMPDLHALAGVDREPTLAAVGSDPAAVAQPAPDLPGLSVLPAPRADAASAGSLARFARADRPTLVDCPAGAGSDAAAPIRAAAGVVVVSTPCAPALRDAAKTAAMARALGTPVVGAVLTRCRVAPDGVGELVDAPVLGTVPEAAPPVLERPAVRDAYDRLAGSLVSQDVLSGPSSGRRSRSP